MSFTFNVPRLADTESPFSVELLPGQSTFFVGANGSGKTRLAAEAEKQLGEKSHRIAAHRSLSLNPKVVKISEEEAFAGLRYGSEQEQWGKIQYRNNQRWGQKEATHLLSDFNFLVQTLFAEQSNTALRTHRAAHARTLGLPQLTKFQQLEVSWNRLLPHRTLEATGDDICVKADDKTYSAAEMSDGERSVFYILGQVLVAEPNSVLIFDEPELHIHRAILGRLWDEVEALRPDCAFLVITHDLEFAASRPGQKFVIRQYQAPGKWEIEPVPEETGFSEEIITLILGSRKPILFVEGERSSLDLAIYRACYPDWTVIPASTCDDVIRSVSMMRKNTSLTRLHCSGIVDADDRGKEDKENLKKRGVEILPVSEIENLFLLPEISAAILKEEKFAKIDTEFQKRLDDLKNDIIKKVKEPDALNKVVLRYCLRRIDRALKKIDLKDATTSDSLAESYDKRTKELDIKALAVDIRDRIEEALATGDLPVLLANFDDKGLLALAAARLKKTKADEFKNWLIRTMRSPNSNALKTALETVLPKIKSDRNQTI